jgi:hypothetical protein
MKPAKIATALVVALLAAWLVVSTLRSNKEQRDLLSWLKIEVVQVDNSTPPGLLIEVRNEGPRIVGTTHFRLVFKADGRDFYRVDEDHGNFGPNEERRILLKAKEVSKHVPFSAGTRIHYFLQAFPEYKKGLGIIEGDFFLK